MQVILVEFSNYFVCVNSIQLYPVEVLLLKNGPFLGDFRSFSGGYGFCTNFNWEEWDSKHLQLLLLYSPIFLCYFSEGEDGQSIFVPDRKPRHGHSAFSNQKNATAWGARWCQPTT